jgi:hypothetical protein
MADPEERFAGSALGRIWKAIFSISAGGAVLVYAWYGWEWSAGFLLGAAASVMNFRWLKRLVDNLGASRQARSQVAVMAGLRYLLLGGGAYVILKYSSISLSGALLGLFVPVAAVIVEIVIELIYART